MLVLARKETQKIILRNDIVVEIVSIRGNRVTVGITAPADVSIVREELKREKQDDPELDTARTGKLDTKGKR